MPPFTPRVGNPTPQQPGHRQRPPCAAVGRPARANPSHCRGACGWWAGSFVALAACIADPAWDPERSLPGIRVPDTNAVQEFSVIRRIDCRLCFRQIRWCRSETISPTIRKRFHRTDASAAPWASPVNHEFMLWREADRWYLLRHSTTLARQRQCAVFHFRHSVFRLSVSQPALLTDVGGEVGAHLNLFSSPTPRQ